MSLFDSLLMTLLSAGVCLALPKVVSSMQQRGKNPALQPNLTPQATPTKAPSFP
jgi:hypothetical protein